MRIGMHYYPEHRLGNRLHVLKRGPYHIALNYPDAALRAPAPAGANFIIGNRTIDPVGIE
jgi:hypothetical protein